MKALKDFLRPEFLGRVDDIIFFRDLHEADYGQIALLHLEELQESLLDKNIKFSWTDEAVQALAAQAAEGSRGARDLRNVLRRQVEDPITTQIVESAGSKLSNVLLSEEEGGVVVAGV